MIQVCYGVQLLERDFPYLLEVVDWSYAYHLGIRPEKERNDDPFWEHRMIEIQAKFVLPAYPKVDMVDIRLRPLEVLNPSERLVAQPTHIGGLSVRGTQASGHVSIPERSFGEAMTALAAGKWKYLALDGDKMMRGHSKLRSYAFHISYDQDDLDDITRIWAAPKKRVIKPKR